MRLWRGKKNCAVFDGSLKSIDLSESDLAQVIIKEQQRRRIADKAGREQIKARAKTRCDYFDDPSEIGRAHV